MSAELKTSAALYLLLLVDFAFVNNSKQHTERTSVVNALVC